MRTNPLLVPAAALLALTSLGCRQDMHNQPRYKALAESDFWGDDRSARPMVDDTVARGQLRLDAARYTGKVDGEDIDYFPWKISQEDIQQGEYRFNIYCSPCHSRLGDGNGMIVQRGFPHPPSYYSDALRKAPNQLFYNVITYGYGAMYSYADRVAPADRWAIVAYIRALQTSESASLSDVPADKRSALR